MNVDPELKSAVIALKSTTEEVRNWAEKANHEIKSQREVIEALDARYKDLEQRVAKRGFGGNKPGEFGMARNASWGEALVDSDGFKSFVKNGMRGKTSPVAIETKSITSAIGSGGALVAPDVRVDPVGLPRRPLTIRDLIAPGQTVSNTVFFPVQTVRSTEAAFVAEDPSAPKPQSDLEWVQKSFPVRTLAHWVPASQQLFEDAPALQSLIDGELRYGLADIEERQLLMGDGTGQNLLGILPQATPFNTALMAGLQNPTMIDVLLMSVAQAETALLPATGLVLHPLDWAKILALKDNQNRYLAGGPLADAFDKFWSIPRVSTVAMTEGQFLLGAFRDGSQIFDRSVPTVLVSTEDRDNFVRNMITILAEERLAFAVKRPAAFITGPLAPPPSS